MDYSWAAPSVTQRSKQRLRDEYRMTMAHQNTGVPATWDPNDSTGLEDFDASDVSMPRLTIEHVDGCFKDSQTEEEFDELKVIFLGLHKSRIMWPDDIGEGEKQDAPLCKSPNYVNGFPNLDPDVAADKRFPWEASNFNQNQLTVINTPEGPTQKTVACSGCRFKEWNTDPSGKRPWCSEEWTIPLLYQPPGTEEWRPALFTTRRSGLKSAKKYISSFATRKMPLFVAESVLSLDKQKRGNVRYATPVFTKVGDTDPGEWMGYKESFMSAKEYLAQLPMPRTEDGEGDDNFNGPVSNTWDAEVVPESNPAATTAATPQASAPTPPPAATPTPEPPVAPPTAAPEAPVAPTQTPSAPTPPAAAPSPEAAPEVTPPMSGSVSIDDDDEPPF